MATLAGPVVGIPDRARDVARCLSCTVVPTTLYNGLRRFYYCPGCNCLVLLFLVVLGPNLRLLPKKVVTTKNSSFYYFSQKIYINICIYDKLYITL